MHPHQSAFTTASAADVPAASGAGASAGTAGARGTSRASDVVAPTLQAIVEALAAVRAQIHTLHAAEATLLSLGDSLADEVATREQHSDHGEMEHRALTAELAAAVHESDRAMAGRISRAASLVQDYPEIHRALRLGRISQIHANLITDAGLVITDQAARARYATAALDLALVETPGRTRPLVKELAVRFAQRPLDERHRDARACRMVRVVELGDGMADLTATLPAVYAFGILDRMNHMARATKQHEQGLASEARGADSAGRTSAEEATAGDATAGDASSQSDRRHSPTRVVRSMDQIRADLLTDMLLASNPNDAATSGCTGISGIRARIQVVIPKAHLGSNTTEHATQPEQETASESKSKSKSGAGEEAGSEPGREAGREADSRVIGSSIPASLAGYGPIDTATARQFAGHAGHWEEITINPDTGAVLSVETYRPNTSLKQFLRARDLHCRFPGCHTPTARCDIDHTVDAALGGPTASTNLAHLCRRHHTLKHHSRWSVRQQHDGTLIWTSPLGTPYSERPPSTVRFGPVPQPAESPPESGQRPGRARQPEPMPF